MRLILGFGAVVCVVAGVVLLANAAAADGAWPVGWRVGLALVSGMAAILCAISAVLGLAEHYNSDGVGTFRSPPHR